MIRILHRNAAGDLRTDLSLDELPAAFADTQGLLWVDFEGEPPEVSQPILTQTFGFHALAVDDALVETHVPKVDDWGTYLYIALHAVDLNLENGKPGGVGSTNHGFACGSVTLARRWLHVVQHSRVEVDPCAFSAPTTHGACGAVLRWRSASRV